MVHEPKNDLVAVIVTFHPDTKVLKALVNSVSSQVLRVLIVDNGSDAAHFACLEGCSNLECIQLGKNLGIAAAQNHGIERAKLLGASYVVLFDQDSNPDPSLLPILYSNLRRLEDGGQRVACVGPRYFDVRQNRPAPFIRIRGCRLERIYCDSTHEIVPVDHLIASGCMIPLSTIEQVGDMAEELFIDYVDLEWCERALVHGFQAYGVCSVTMAHALGDEPIVFMGQPRPARSPLRHYYMMRNAVWIYRQPWPRLGWKVADALRLLRKYVFYSIFAKPRMVHFRMMSQGLWDGLNNQMGPYRGR